MNKTSFTIYDVKMFVEENSECKLISKEYKNADSLLTLKCPCGEEFITKFRYFKYQNKKKCNKCTDKKNGIVNSIESAIHLVYRMSDGKCSVVSDEYIDNKTPLDIVCGCGNLFKCSITNIKQKKVVQCKFCAHNVFRLTAEGLLAIAESGNCEILNLEDYSNENSKLDFKCECGNVFKTSLASFKGSHKRCDSCFRKHASSSQRKDFDEVKSIIEKIGMGCELISNCDEYINQYCSLRFKCTCGEEFDRSYTNFIRLDKSCPRCTSSTGEKAVAKHLESIGVSFESEYTFNGLVSRKGHPLRFDFALKEDGRVSALIEYDGEFHFSPIISEELFLRQRCNDNLKNEHCKHNNIPLLRIPYHEFDNIETLINTFLL